MPVLNISYWNIQDLTADRAKDVGDKVIPWLNKRDVMFVMEGMASSATVADDWVARHNKQYSNVVLKGVSIDASDTTQRNERYLVFWNEKTTGKAAVALQTYNPNTDKKPPGRVPVVLTSAKIVAAAWHAPGPGTKDNENYANALGHATVLAKAGVQLFGGDMNYNNASGKLGTYAVLVNNETTTLGGNSYDFAGHLPALKCEAGELFAPGISDHKAITVKAFVA